MSQIINGYEIHSKMKNSGFSKWGFCERNGEQYFIKEFLQPTYPLNDTATELMTCEQLLKKKRECEEFETRLSDIYNIINKNSDGNVIRVEEFFREGTKYYSVTKKIDSYNSSIEEISKWDYQYKYLICKLVSHSVLCLHNAKFVHADLKPDNVLIKFSTNKCTAKLIDFDCGFLEYSPPEIGNELNGDLIYFAPEALMFMAGNDVKLSCKMDVFALGVLFHQYLTGKQPDFDSEKYDYAAEAVLDDCELGISKDIPECFAGVLKKMLCKNPGERISIDEVYRMIYLEEKNCYLNKTNIKIYSGNVRKKEEIFEEESMRSNDASEKFFSAGDLL